MCAQDEERTIWENSERDTEGWETEWVRRVLKSGAATSHFSAMAQSLLGKGKPGELFHRASPLSVWSLQSAPPEFLHHVILFMGRKTQPSEAQTGRGHITAAAICEWRWFRVFFFFSARQKSSKTSEKTFLGILIAKLILSSQSVNMECFDMSCQWDLILSSCHSGTSGDHLRAQNRHQRASSDEGWR